MEGTGTRFRLFVHVAILSLIVSLGIGLDQADGETTTVQPGSSTFIGTGFGWAFTVPDGVYYLTVELRGAHGGGPMEHVARGGSGGVVDAVLPVTPHQDLLLSPGVYGNHKGGWSGFGLGGDHGATWGPSSGESGAGGGGSTGLFAHESDATPMIVAGGGGGAGGNDNRPAEGADGGYGGLPAQQGFPGLDETGTVNDENLMGGCGGCMPTPNGHKGEGTSFSEIVGGGGGGGGGGWKGGGGGDNGVYRSPQADPIGGSGGGGGLSWASSSAHFTKYSISGSDCSGVATDDRCQGQVVLSWGQSPSRIDVSSGDGQSATVTSDMAPIAVIATTGTGVPVPGVSIEFTLPANGPSGSFPGSAKRVSVDTGIDGVATVPRLTANGIAGNWTAVASATGLAVTAKFNLRNQPAATRTVATSDRNPSAYGEAVQFTALISSSAPSLSPTGRVQFTFDGDPAGLPVMLGTDGKAALPLGTAPALSAGPHVVEARYLGDSGHSSSQDDLTQVVERVPTAVELTAEPGPSSAGEEVELAATVSGGSQQSGVLPSGSVEFIDSDGETLGSAPLDTNGVALITTDDLPVGTSRITAEYPGDTIYAPGKGSVDHGVGPEATVTAVSSSLNPSFYGEPPTWRAKVRRSGQGVALNGTIAFAVDGAATCPAQEVDSVGTVTCESPAGLDAGIHSIEATYSPLVGSSDLASQGTIEQVIVRAHSTTVASADPEPSVFGEPVTLGALVSAGSFSSITPAGSAAFLIDGQPAGPAVPLDQGRAAQADRCGQPTGSCPLVAGSHVIEAEYLPDGPNVGPSHAATVHRVGPTATSVDLRSDQDPAPSNQRLTFNAAVTSASGTVRPFGRVQFLIDGQASGEAVAIVGGAARSLPVESLREGRHEVTARYLGSVGFSPSEVTIAQEIDPVDNDLGTPNLKFRGKHVRVDRNGSAWIRAECFGEPGATCQARSVLRTTEPTRITKRHRPGTARRGPRTALSYRDVSLPAGSSRRLRFDLTNVAGRIMSATRRVHSRIGITPDPGTAQAADHRLSVLASRAPVIRILDGSIRVVAGRATVRIKCVRSKVGACRGRVGLVAPGVVVGGRPVRLAPGSRSTVKLNVPARYTPGHRATLRTHSQVRIGFDRTSNWVVRIK